MAIVKCKECSSDVSSKAETCPKCGVKVARHLFKKMINWVYWFFATIAMITLLLVVTQCSHSLFRVMDIQQQKYLENN